MTRLRCSSATIAPHFGWSARSFHADVSKYATCSRRPSPGETNSEVIAPKGVTPISPACPAFFDVEQAQQSVALDHYRTLSSPDTCKDVSLQRVADRDVTVT